MVTIYKTGAGLGQGISDFGTALSGALDKRTEQNRQSEGLNIFQKGIQGAEGDPNTLAQVYTQAVNAGASPEHLKLIQDKYDTARKNNAFQVGYDESLNYGGMETDEGHKAFTMAYVKAGGDPFDLAKFMKKPAEKKQSIFDKKMDAFKADAVIDHAKGGSSVSVFENNLDFLNKNIDRVGRAKSYVGGGLGIAGGGERGPFKSALFTEYENRGNLVLDGVIKVFNKAGVLPDKKLKWIRDTFAVSPYDTQETIRGKLNSLSSLSKTAVSYENGLGELIEKYGANIPTKEFIKLQRDLDKKIDQFEDHVNSPQQEQVVDKLTNKGYKKNDVATDSKTGQKFIFNGTRWVKNK